MLTKPQSHRHAAARPHAKVVESAEESESSLIKERMRACVSQDRFEALGLHYVHQGTLKSAEGASEVQDLAAPAVEQTETTGADGENGAPSPQQLANRLLLLEVVGQESEVIRTSLNVCERISKLIAEPEM